MAPYANNMMPSLQLGSGSNNMNGMPNGTTYYDTSSGQVMNVTNGIAAPRTASAPSQPVFEGFGGGSARGGAGASGSWGDPSPTVQTGPSANEIAAQQARSRAITGYQTSGQNVRQSGIDQAGASTTQQRGSILDYFQDAGRTLTGLNQRRTNSEMSRNAGTRDILGMVGRGIQSGNVMLSNKNAANSSAKDLIAKAYGQVGNRESGKLQNQYGLEQQNINTEQAQFNEDINTFTGRKLDDWKNTQAEAIANDVRSRLADLNLASQNADLGTLFEIEQEKQSIKNQAMQKFSELDGLVSTERAKLSPLDVQGARGKAMEAEQLGQAAPQMFDFDSTAPVAQQQGNSMGNTPGLYSFTPQRRRGY